MEADQESDTRNKLKSSGREAARTKKLADQLKTQLDQRELQLRQTERSLELEKEKCRKLEEILETRLKKLNL
jgi:hypothetical protein